MNKPRPTIRTTLDELHAIAHPDSKAAQTLAKCHDQTTGIRKAAQHVLRQIEGGGTFTMKERT